MMYANFCAQARCGVLGGILRNEYVDSVHMGCYQRFGPCHLVFLYTGWTLR